MLHSHFFPRKTFSFFLNNQLVLLQLSFPLPFFLPFLDKYRTNPSCFCFLVSTGGKLLGFYTFFSVLRQKWMIGWAQNLPENWVSKQSFFVLILTTAQTKWVESLWGFTNLNFKLNLKVSAFYLEKQKSFIPKKNIFWAVPPRYIQKMALAVSIFQKVLLTIWETWRMRRQIRKGERKNWSKE